MTNMITSSHNKGCKYKGHSVAIIEINLDTRRAMLSCGCEINLRFDLYITTY